MNETERDLHLEDPAKGWYVMTPATPTPEEQAILDANMPNPDSTTPPTPEQMGAVQNVFSALAARSRQQATSEDAAAAQAIYDSHIVEGAALIHAVITLPDGRGIINRRVGNDHQQIRF